MPKFTGPFKGLCKGDRYETDFFSGDECPKELLELALEAGAVSLEKNAKKKPVAKAKAKPAAKSAAAKKATGDSVKTLIEAPK